MMSEFVGRRFVAWAAVAVLAATPLASVAFAAPAAAAGPYVVDTVTDDAGLSACTGAAFDCSLRGAVASANTNAGTDTIEFDIPASACLNGVCRINLTGNPITITDAVNLDATTQPQNDAPRANVCATAADPSYMRIEVVSAEPAGSATIFNVGNTDGVTTISGFAFGTNAGSTPGIDIYEGSGHHIFCNHFGLDGPGVDILGTGDFTASIALDGNASQVVVGTDGDGVDDVGERNVFGAPGTIAAVYITTAGAVDHQVAGNYFGFTADGTTQLGGGRGVDVAQSARSNLIGSNLDGVSDDLERNYFGGDRGVLLNGSSGAVLNNHVVGNVFGTSPAGTAAPMTVGIDLSLTATSTGNEIRDNYVGAATYGVYAAGPTGAAGFHLEHNVFGVDPDGHTRANGDAIRLSYAHPNVISNNLIANSIMTGLAISDEVTLVSSTGNCIIGNSDGVHNFTGTGDIAFENNWWGSSTGPSGAGAGAGDSVSANVDFDPWLTADPGGCGPEVVAGDADFTLAEDAPVGTAVGPVTASGAGTLVYSITAGNTGSVFAIDAATGAITTAASLDYETTPSYTLTVEVSNGPDSDTATVTVDVTDVFETPTTPTFDDVPGTHTFFTDVEWLADQGITKGCNPPANNLFCPDDSVPRGQMAAFLHRALATMIMQGPPVTFTDIAGSVFVDDIQWLGNTGITKGCNPPTNDMFCPNEVVTRGQMAAFLVRALGYTDDGGGNSFVDDDGSVFEGDVAKLAAAGVTKGCNPPTNDMFCPNDPVTRGQMAAFLHRALGGT